MATLSNAEKIAAGLAAVPGIRARIAEIVPAYRVRPDVVELQSLCDALEAAQAEIERLRDDLNNTVMLLRRASVKLPPCTLVLNINDYLSRKRLQGGILRDAALPAPAATKPCPACNGTGEGENSGVCHCGDPMDHSAWEAGHSPVEMAYPCDKCGGSGKAAPAATKEGERS